jgi:hypothetical protein
MDWGPTTRLGGDQPFGSKCARVRGNGEWNMQDQDLWSDRMTLLSIQVSE